MVFRSLIQINNAGYHHHQWSRTRDWFPRDKISKWKPIAVVSILKMNYCQCFNQHPIDINKIKCLSLLYTSIQISLVKATRYQFPDKPLQNIVLSTPFRFHCFNVQENSLLHLRFNILLSFYKIWYIVFSETIFLVFNFYQISPMNTKKRKHPCFNIWVLIRICKKKIWYKTIKVYA